MAINRQPREDLMREATAYAQRLLLSHPGFEPIFVGVRPQGGWSIYFGEDPVFQFNAAQQLRRAHFGDQSYAAEQGRLTQLRRQRAKHLDQGPPAHAGRVEIDRRYDEAAEQRVLQDCHYRCSSLAHALAQGTATVTEQHPKERELIPEVVKLLMNLPSEIVIADSSNA